MGAGHTIKAVVTTPARRQGRGLRQQDSPVALAASRLGIATILTPESPRDSSLAEALSALGADLFLVVAYRILPREVFSLAPLGTFNIHGSLLPAYRGPAPIQRAIEAGERETGVTVFRINEGVDTGTILLQRRCAIGDHETTPELYERMSGLGAQATVEALEICLSGAPLLRAQNDQLATAAPKLRKEEAVLDWNTDAPVLFNKIRAFKPFPGTHTLRAGSRLGIEWALPVNYAQATPGMVVQNDKNGFTIACGSGALWVTQVKPEGKKSMDAASYARGAHLEVGEVFG